MSEMGQSPLEVCMPASRPKLKHTCQKWLKTAPNGAFAFRGRYETNWGKYVNGSYQRRSACQSYLRNLSLQNQLKRIWGVLVISIAKLDEAQSTHFN